MNTVPNLLFSATSRYHNIDTSVYKTDSGKEVIYLKRRFLPPADQLTHTFQEHVVVQSDRLDNITARYLNDAQQFWRLCDTNNAMNPPELTSEIGRRLRITLADGIPGLAHVI